MPDYMDHLNNRFRTLNSELIKLRWEYNEAWGVVSELEEEVEKLKKIISFLEHRIPPYCEQAYKEYKEKLC